MARRVLTIASMATPGSVTIEQVANTDEVVTTFHGKRMTVTRSSDGRTFSWETNQDHIRIYVNMEGPADLPFITHSSSGSGWFQLEGFPLILLGSPSLRVDAIAEAKEEMLGFDDKK